MSTDDAYVPGFGLKVTNKRCDECLYSDNKIVDEERKKEILNNCKKTGKYFLCHKGTLNNNAVICRGFYDEGNNSSCQIAQRLGIIKFVTIPVSEFGSVKKIC